MAKVVKCDDGCWLWTGDRSNRFGYGRLGQGGRGAHQRLILAHRASWEVHIGPIPDGLRVLHRCDVPACVNPDHLFLGTLSDNIQDALAKGRHVTKRGSLNPRAKLSPSAVAAIRSNPKQKSISDLAREYGVSRRAVRFAKDGITWK